MPINVLGRIIEYVLSINRIWSYNLHAILPILQFIFSFFFQFFFLKYILSHYQNLQNKSPKKSKKKSVELRGGFELMTPSSLVFHSPSIPHSSLIKEEEKNMYLNYNFSILMLPKGTWKKSSWTKSNYSIKEKFCQAAKVSYFWVLALQNWGHVQYWISIKNLINIKISSLSILF